MIQSSRAERSSQRVLERRNSQTLQCPCLPTVQVVHVGLEKAKYTTSKVYHKYVLVFGHWQPKKGSPKLESRCFGHDPRAERLETLKETNSPNSDGYLGSMNLGSAHTFQLPTWSLMPNAPTRPVSSTEQTSLPDCQDREVKTPRTPGSKTQKKKILCLLVAVRALFAFYLLVSCRHIRSK